MTVIREDDLRQSIADALQFISYYHPQDFIRHMVAAYEREQSAPAKAAMAQILRNSRMAALGKRPLCQDTGSATVSLKIGMAARIDSRKAFQEIVNDAVREAYRLDTNPLRASMVYDAVFDRRNTGDNTPGYVSVTMVEGEGVDLNVSAKGAGSENKAKFAILDPGENIVDWVVRAVESMGAGWCPPGILGIGVGGGADKAMLLAKEALSEPLDMADILARGPSTKAEEMRIAIYERVNSLGIGAQGLGGLISVLDVKLKSFATHAASLPVALIPNCAATRHVHFSLDGSGPAVFTPPDLIAWPDLPDDPAINLRRFNLEELSADSVRDWKAGETILLSGKLYTGRDAAHRRMAEMIARGESLPVDLRDKAIYYVGPVDAVGEEIIGPAGPTTSTRMDRYLPTILSATGLRLMIGKAERSVAAVDTIRETGAVYVIAVGGAAYLIAKSIRAARVVAWSDLGMEAIHEFEVYDMPVMVAVDTTGTSVHVTGPALWRNRFQLSQT